MEVEAIAPPAPASPWRTIWFSPRRTVRSFMDDGPWHSFMPVMVLVAVQLCFAALRRDPTDATVSLELSLFPVLFAVARLISSVLVGPFILAFVGRLLGGEADPTDIRQAVVWSMVPNAVVVIWWIPTLIAYHGPPMPLPNPSALQLIFQLISIPLALVATVAAGWTFVLTVIAFAEVQRFSVLRSVVCFAIVIIPPRLLLMV